MNPAQPVRTFARSEKTMFSWQSQTCLNAAECVIKTPEKTALSSYLFVLREYKERYEVGFFSSSFMWLKNVVSTRFRMISLWRKNRLFNFKLQELWFTDNK